MKEINKPVYQASDGKIFTEKEECIEYEKTIEIVLLDANFNVLEMNDNGIENNSYMYIGNEKSLEFIRDKGDYLGVFAPYDIGYWYWDDDDGEFKSLTEVIDYLTEKLNNLNKAKETIDKEIKEN